MKTGRPCNQLQDESAAVNLIEYLMVSGVILALFIVMLLLVSTNILEDPSNRLMYVAFTDVGNGVSTRVIDVYAISPADGTIYTIFDIPDEIVGKDYSIEVGTRPNDVNNAMNDQYITISRGSLTTDVALSGIGATKNASGSTSGRGLNTICYNSSGVIPEVKC